MIMFRYLSRKLCRGHCPFSYFYLLIYLCILFIDLFSNLFIMINSDIDNLDLHLSHTFALDNAYGQCVCM